MSSEDTKTGFLNKGKTLSKAVMVLRLVQNDKQPKRHIAGQVSVQIFTDHLDEISQAVNLDNQIFKHERSIIPSECSVLEQPEGLVGLIIRLNSGRLLVVADLVPEGLANDILLTVNGACSAMESHAQIVSKLWGAVVTSVDLSSQDEIAQPLLRRLSSNAMDQRTADCLTKLPLLSEKEIWLRRATAAFRGWRSSRILRAQTRGKSAKARVARRALAGWANAAWHSARRCRMTARSVTPTSPAAWPSTSAKPRSSPPVPRKSA